MGYHFLLQGIIPTQGSNLGLLHCGQTPEFLYLWKVHCHSDLSIYAIFCNSPKSLSIIILIITSKSQLLYLSCVCVCVCAQSCLPLCDPMDYSPPGSSVHGIFQARILEWVAISYSRGSSRPRDQTCVLASQFFTTALIILCCNFYFHFLFF